MRQILLNKLYYIFSLDVYLKIDAMIHKIKIIPIIPCSTLFVKTHYRDKLYCQ